MAKGKKSSPSNKAHYQSYKAQGVWLKNKIVKLKRTVKEQPENKVAIAALKKAESGQVKFNKKTPQSVNKHKQSYFEFCSNLYAKFI